MEITPGNYLKYQRSLRTSRSASATMEVEDAATGGGSMAPQILQFIERARPVGAQEPGKAAIGEHPASGLAPRAVVRFVVRITDTENFRAAPGARFSVPSVNGHAFAKRSDLLREPLARLGATAARATVRACRESRRRAGPIPPPVNLRVKARGESRAAWRISSEYAFPTPLTMRGSVNARFKVRFSRISRHGVIRWAESSSNAASPWRSAGCRTSDRDALRLSPASVQRERSRRKTKAPTSGTLEGGVGSLPLQGAGDHQVQHEPEVAIQADSYSLSHSPQLAHSSSRGFARSPASWFEEETGLLAARLRAAAPSRAVPALRCKPRCPAVRAYFPSLHGPGGFRKACGKAVRRGRNRTFHGSGFASRAPATRPRRRGLRNRGRISSGRGMAGRGYAVSEPTRFPPSSIVAE